MDTYSAIAMGMANRGKPSMVFDWIKAANIIVSRKAKEASAGLHSDWEYTGGVILEDGRPVPAEDTYTFLASTWATPELCVDGVTMDCYVMQDETPGWHESTYWPQEALDILEGKNGVLSITDNSSN
jgi:hypothetical protein